MSPLVQVMSVWCVMSVVMSVFSFSSLSCTCSPNEIMLYLITTANINVIKKLKGDTHSESIPNIDVTSASFFFPQICCTLFMFYFFAPSLLFFNFWPIHNGCCVSQEFGSGACGHCSEIDLGKERGA